jgi:hypothetical protein
VVNFREYVPSIDPCDAANRIGAELSMVGAQLDRSTAEGKEL